MSIVVVLRWMGNYRRGLVSLVNVHLFFLVLYREEIVHCLIAFISFLLRTVYILMDWVNWKSETTAPVIVGTVDVAFYAQALGLFVLGRTMQMIPRGAPDSDKD